MKIQVALQWVESGKVNNRSFKTAPYWESCLDYAKRVNNYTAFEYISQLKVRPESSQLWICDIDKTSKAWSSEKVAEELNACMNSGVQKLVIGVGGADGWNESHCEQLKPNKIWSFGPLTLPHELAAVVASEQLYRAWTILRNEPYHLGH